MLRTQNIMFVKKNPYLKLYNHQISNDLSAIFNDDNFFISG